MSIDWFCFCALISAVVGANLVLEPRKKCHEAEIWLKHAEICVQ